MDTKEKYRNDARLEVEYPPQSERRENHPLDRSLHVHGYAHLWYQPPDGEGCGDDGEGRCIFISVPFRAEGESGDRWFVNPDGERGDRHPVWKWTNSGENPHEHLTLEPSIGRRDDEGDYEFHLRVEDGEIHFL